MVLDSSPGSMTGAHERVLVGDDVAVGLQLAYRQGFYKHYSSSVSRIIVTGPSFTEATCISAPNSPVSTLKPRLRHSEMTSS